jgi:hypothetical protein
MAFCLRLAIHTRYIGLYIYSYSMGIRDSKQTARCWCWAITKSDSQSVSDKSDKSDNKLDHIQRSLSPQFVLMPPQFVFSRIVKQSDQDSNLTNRPLATICTAISQTALVHQPERMVAARMARRGRPPMEHETETAHEEPENELSVC